MAHGDLRVTMHSAAVDDPEQRRSYSVLWFDLPTAGTQEQLDDIRDNLLKLLRGGRAVPAPADSGYSGYDLTGTAAKLGRYQRTRLLFVGKRCFQLSALGYSDPEARAFVDSFKSTATP